jgi:hypothetical protein
MSDIWPFDGAPPPELCRKVVDYISAVRHPSHPPHPVDFSDPAHHFHISDLVPLLQHIRAVLESPDLVVTGWLSSIRAFWIGNSQSLYLFILRYHDREFESDARSVDLPVPLSPLVTSPIRLLFLTFFNFFTLRVEYNCPPPDEHFYHCHRIRHCGLH